MKPDRSFDHNGYFKKTDTDHVWTLDDGGLEPAFLKWMEKHHLCFADVETTGLNPEKNGLTQVAAFRVQNGTPEIFQAYIKPTRKNSKSFDLSAEAAEKTGASYDPESDQLIMGGDAVKTAVPFHEVAKDFASFIGKDSRFVAHNAAFDAGFLKKQLEFAGQRVPNTLFDPSKYICTMFLTADRYPGHTNLDDAYRKAVDPGFKMRGKHNAKEDVWMSIHLLQALWKTMSPAEQDHPEQLTMPKIVARMKGVKSVDIVPADEGSPFLHMTMDASPNGRIIRDYLAQARHDEIGSTQSPDMDGFNLEQRALVYPGLRSVNWLLEKGFVTDVKCLSNKFGQELLGLTLKDGTDVQLDKWNLTRNMDYFVEGKWKRPSFEQFKERIVDIAEAKNTLRGALKCYMDVSNHSLIVTFNNDKYKQVFQDLGLLSAATGDLAFTEHTKGNGQTTYQALLNPKRLGIGHTLEPRRINLIKAATKFADMPLVDAVHISNQSGTGTFSIETQSALLPAALQALNFATTEEIEHQGKKYTISWDANALTGNAQDTTRKSLFPPYKVADVAWGLHQFQNLATSGSSKVFAKATILPADEEHAARLQLTFRNSTVKNNAKKVFYQACAQVGLIEAPPKHMPGDRLPDKIELPLDTALKYDNYMGSEARPGITRIFKNEYKELLNQKRGNPPSSGAAAGR